jgi:ATP-dependent Clp protease ATP-binding subunit ClpA
MVRLNVPLDATRTGCEAESLDRSIHKLIVGQDEAIHQIVNVYQTYLAGMNSADRPVGSFLFLGPTGSGKTRIVEAAAESLVGSARSVVKIDCAEFQHSHEIAKLIGSPPGYLGHRETHPLLSQEVLNQYHTDKVKLSFVLFDEIEKASDALWNLLLGILDKGTLTLGDNRRVDFSKTMVFLTSNLGASEMSSILKPNLGFAAGELSRDLDAGITSDSLSDKIARAGVEAARRRFTPEFMNRLDKTVVFRPLGQTELRQILDIELHLLQQRIFDSVGPNYFVFRASEPAKAHLLTEGTDLKYGARHLRRAIDRLVVQPLSNLIATDQIHTGDLVRMDFGADLGGVTFSREAEGMGFEAMAEMAGVSIAVPLAAASGIATETVRVAAARSSRRA